MSSIAIKKSKLASNSTYNPLKYDLVYFTPQTIPFGLIHPFSFLHAQVGSIIAKITCVWTQKGDKLHYRVNWTR